MILEKTIDFIIQLYKTHKIQPPRVTKVVIGLNYTGVQIKIHDNIPFLGLASTLTSITNKFDCSALKFSGSLTTKTIRELLSWCSEIPSIKKIIGIATLNSVSQHVLSVIKPYKRISKTLLEYLKIDKQTTVTFIGLMKPLIRNVRRITKLITIIEDTIPVNKEFEELNIKHRIQELKGKELSTDLLICSGTTLLNDSIEKILDLFRKKAQKVIILGPTASLVPDILFDYGVDILGGIEINDLNAVIRVIQEGGGTKLFKPFTEKYNLIKE